MPTFSGVCPGDIHVDANSHGTVRINGERAKVRKSNDNYYEARHGKITISIALDPSGLLLSYALKGGANGICTVTAEEAGTTSSPSTGMPSQDEHACLLAVTQQTNNGDVVLLNTETPEANTAVIVGVGENRAKWRCLVKDGIVDEVMSLADEGTL